MKKDGRLDRNWLNGALGDAIHAVLCGAGHNLRMILRNAPTCSRCIAPRFQFFQATTIVTRGAYDGHTLAEALEHAAILCDATPEVAIVDRGYKGVAGRARRHWR
ncbi:hypothetical protein HDG38_004093 [Paraburkholderia sp. WSM4177]|nr:hypothetical protein [Paraburkholderia sp. WSM4177]MBB5486058.1 hypothetical protein [Paraburkholderia sp. WSM4180]